MEPAFPRKVSALDISIEKEAKLGATGKGERGVMLRLMLALSKAKATEVNSRRLRGILRVTVKFE